MSKNLTLASEMLADLAELPISDRKIVVRILAAAVGAEGDAEEETQSRETGAQAPAAVAREQATPPAHEPALVPASVPTQEPAASPKAPGTTNHPPIVNTNHPPIVNQILAVLRLHPQGISASDLSKAIGVKTQDAKWKRASVYLRDAGLAIMEGWSKSAVWKLSAYVAANAKTP